MAILLVLLFAILLIAGPVVAGVLGIQLGLAGVISMGVGLMTALVSGIVLTVTKLYHKTSADQAFVRTGQGGAKVVKDGGCLVIPVIHTVVPVSLRTFKLEVTSENEQAMITKDKLRADIEAEFFIRVNPEQDSILQASRSIGGRMVDVEAVKELVEDKLISALRSAAANKTLEELNSERDQFLDSVREDVGADLSPNGFVLETATISKLDQTDEKFLRKDGNMFDAQGARKMAEIVQKNLTERNVLVREGERARTEQDVDTKKQVLSLQQQEAEAQAKQQAEIAQVNAQQEQAARQAEIASAQAVELSDVQKQEALAIAATKKQEAVMVAEQQKEEAIAEAREQKALKEAEMAKAQALKTAEVENIKTVEVTATAEREKEKAVIAARATADAAYVDKQRAADAGAYEVKTKANADKEAAEAKAAAIEREALAHAEAKKAEANGLRAVQMVPVDVDRKQVEVEQDRVENVLKQELEARENSGKVAQEFEIAKLQVDANRDVQVAQAHAVASIWQRADVKLYGTADQVDSMMTSMMQGQTFSQKIDSFFENEGAATALGATAADIAENVAKAVSTSGNSDDSLKGRLLGKKSSKGNDGGPTTVA
jgi:flotillin